MKIRQLLLTCFGTLGLIVAGFSGIILHDAVGVYRNNTDFLAANQADEALLGVAAQMAVERGQCNAPLHAPDAMPAAKHDEVLKTRVVADAYFAEAVRQLGALPQMAGSRDAIGKFEAGYRSLGELRGKVDANLAKPAAERTGEVVDNWAPATTALIAQATYLRLALEAMIPAPGAELTQLVELRHLAAEMAEQAGQERFIIGGNLAQRKPLSRAQIALLSEHHGHVQLGWDVFVAYGLRPDLGAATREAIAAVDSEYIKKLEELRRAVLAASESGDYPVKGPEWVERSGTAIDAILKLSRTMSAAARDAARASEAASLWRMLLGLVLMTGGVLTAAGSVWLVGRRAIRPLLAIAEALERLAAGDRSTLIVGSERRDEIGAMARAVGVFKDSVVERLLTEQADTKQRAEMERKAALRGLADEFEASVRGVVSSVSSAAFEMEQTARTMASTIEQAKERSSTVATAAGRASSNVETVAAAAEELTASIAEIGRQVSQSAEIARRAEAESDRTSQTVDGLSQAAQRIGEVVQLINSIAAQTNLLALNATIEAARAGDAGRGFAVVATEVKSLAMQTAKATDDIRAQIVAIQAQTGSTVAEIRGICATIVEVNEISAAIASAIVQQNAATQDIASNVQRAAVETAVVSEAITGVTEAASETETAAVQVTGSAGELARQSHVLKTVVDRFLDTVRAA
jgi:methyl-accepting chemotaxis protein